MRKTIESASVEAPTTPSGTGGTSKLVTLLVHEAEQESILFDALASAVSEGDVEATIAASAALIGVSTHQPPGAVAPVRSENTTHTNKTYATKPTRN